MPYFLIGLGALALYLVASSSSAATSSAASGNRWPPTAADQQALQNQVLSAVQSAQPPPTAQQLQQVAAELQPLLAQAPAQYLSTLAPGQTPMVAGYQAWAMGQLYQGVMAGAQSMALPQAGTTDSSFFPPAGYTG